MKIKITSDSTCDLTQGLVCDRFHIDTVPLYVIMDGVSYRGNSMDITTEQIFAHVAAGGALCSTSAVSENDYIEFFTRELQDCEGLVHVTLSSKMSVCYQNAGNAARHFEHVQVVDSLNLSSAQGLIVMGGRGAGAGSDAGRGADCPAPARNRAQGGRQLCAGRPGISASKGGRCSTVAALGANLLGIKPCIEVHNGQMGVAKKYRGAHEKALRNYVRERLEGNDTLRTHRIMITHTPVDDGIVDMVRDEILQYQPFAEVLPTDARGTISCHCGPNTLGILYIHK